MKALCIILIAVFLSGCQAGLIPCPKAEAIKMKRSSPGYGRAQNTGSSAIANRSQAEVEPVESKKPKPRVTPKDEKFVKNVSEEEWDCPRPGSKKYLPKSVRRNIRANMKKIREDDKQSVSDPGQR